MMKNESYAEGGEFIRHHTDIPKCGLTDNERTELWMRCLICCQGGLELNNGPAFFFPDICNTCNKTIRNNQPRVVCYPIPLPELFGGMI